MLKINQAHQNPTVQENYEYSSIEFTEKEENILHPPKTSKISSKLSKTIEKSLSQEIDSRETKNTSLVCDDNFETHTMLFIKVNLIVNNLVKSSSFIMNSSINIDCVIERAIESFNALFEKEKTSFKLKTDPKLFGLKQTKKNGFPKVDMPNFNLKTSLTQTKNIQFSLIWNEDPSNYKDYFIIEHIKEREKGSKCRDCIIF